MRVLVFASDMLPLPGLATSGGGLRSWQIIQGLQSAGLDVSFSMPVEDRYLGRLYKDKIPKEVVDLAWNFHNQDRIVQRVRPDVLVFANPDLNHLKQEWKIPIASDLHGPRIIEFELMSNDLKAANRPYRLMTKINNLLKSDFLTCAGIRQRYYFLGFLLQAGIPLHDISIEYMPVSLSPVLPDRTQPAVEEKSFIYAGGFYPWQDVSSGLLTLSERLKQRNEGRLVIYGGSHRLHERDSRDFDSLMEELKKNPRVHFAGYVSREELLQHYLSGYVFYEVMGRNHERELAFTTRTVEALWCGLPVIYNNYSDLSDYIGRYNSGWCVDTSDRRSVESAIDEALDSPQGVKERGSNAQRLVREHLTWDKTIQPLADFCKNPVIKESKERCVVVLHMPRGKLSALDKAYIHFRQKGLGHLARRAAGTIARRTKLTARERTPHV
ncbi:MAG: glycosyltransferase family 4 protein [Candidatus Aureabacteria bacterium]|nr:glycosyltransferase family 4 protein [Candidatus Auribacterota bacterium]